MLSGLKNKKIKISLPNFYDFSFLNRFFLFLQENKKNVFNDDFEITSVDGCFPSSYWSLSRNNKYVNKKRIREIINLYSHIAININYIFDNDCITKSDLSDNFSNLVLELAHREGNGVFVKSDLLYKYIKKHFPLYKIIKIAAPKEFSEKNIAIIDKYNNKILQSKIKYKKEAYITLNPVCYPDCKYYNDHKIFIGNEQRNFYKKSTYYVCPIKEKFDFCEMQKNSNFISLQKMQEFIDAGFEHFRIDYPFFQQDAGISYNVYDALESYIYYLIKPKEQNNIRLEALKKIEEFKNDE